MANSKSHRGSLTLLVASLLLILIPSAGSQGTVEISLGALSGESTADIDQDGIFEYLTVEVELIVYKAGTYGLHGSLGQGITANVGPLELGIGSHTLELSFSGGPLSLSSISGSLPIEVEGYSTDPDSETVKEKYFTEGEYVPSMFEAPEEGTGTTVSIFGDEVVIRGKKMEVRVNMTSPRITFSYPEQLRKDTLSSITYLEVLAFNDLDNDGKWDQGTDELRYSSDLSDVDWEIGTDFTRGFDIQLYGVLQLRLAGTSTAAAWARMTFSMSSEYLEIDPPSQKFDIDLDLWQPLDAEMIAVRHQLVDETGRFEIVEGNGPGMDDHSLTVKNSDGRAYGTYSWTDEIMVGDLELDNSTKAVSWYEIGEGEASVWFSYPLEGNIQLIHHDPTLSMDPVLPPLDEEEDFLVDRPLFMIGGIIVGVIVVGGTIIGRRLKRPPRDRGGGD